MDYRTRREAHKQTMKRGLWAIANRHDGIPGQCSRDWACQSYINRMGENAANDFSRFVIPSHAAETFWDTYNTIYNSEFSKCSVLGQRDPVMGVLCLGNFERNTREIAARAPLPAITPHRGAPPVRPPFPDGMLPARSEFVPFVREEPRTYLPTPDAFETRRRVQPQVKRAVPTRIDPRGVPRPDIKIVDTHKTVDKVAPATAPVAKPKAEGMSTNMKLGLAAGAALVLFLVMRKK